MRHEPRLSMNKFKVVCVHLATRWYGSGHVTTSMATMKCGAGHVLMCMQLKCPFQDGDMYHPAANVEKMRAGVPLTDEDRVPWLLALHQVIVG